MAKDVRSGKPPAPSASADPPSAMRHVYSPRTLASLLPAITRPAFKSRSPAAVQLMTDWAALVGPQTAAIAAPRRFSGGTLTLAANGPAALELQHLAPQLIARINTGLGRQIVERLRFVQDDSINAATQAAPRAAAPVPVAVEGLPKNKLHNTLTHLNNHITTHTKH